MEEQSIAGVQIKTDLIRMPVETFDTVYGGIAREQLVRQHIPLVRAGDDRNRSVGRTNRIQWQPGSQTQIMRLEVKGLSILMIRVDEVQSLGLGDEHDQESFDIRSKDLLNNVQQFRMRWITGKQFIVLVRIHELPQSIL